MINKTSISSNGTVSLKELSESIRPNLAYGDSSELQACRTFSIVTNPPAWAGVAATSNVNIYFSNSLMLRPKVSIFFTRWKHHTILIICNLSEILSSRVLTGRRWIQPVLVVLTAIVSYYTTSGYHAVEDFFLRYNLGSWVSVTLLRCCHPSMHVGVSIWPVQVWRQGQVRLALRFI